MSQVVYFWSYRQYWVVEG